MKNKVANFRNFLNLTQKDMAKEFNISVQAYYRKEKGYTPFTDKEKVAFRNMVQEDFPDITIDAIFFTE